MRFWIAKQSQVPVREQLATQLLLGILGEDLRAGQKLPSTRELARRLGIHPNTVSAVYRDLTRRGWVESRPGSGVYVRARSDDAKVQPDLRLEQLISRFFDSLREKGYLLGEVQACLRRWLDMKPPDHFLVVEPDAELRRILAAEIAGVCRFPVRGARPEECRDSDLLVGAVPVFLFNKAEGIRSFLPPVAMSLVLHARSALADLERQIPIRPEALIAIVSGWPEFLRWARAVLVAAGVDADALVLRDTHSPGWRRVLAGCTAVITDAWACRQMPPGHRVHVAHLIADSSLDQLRHFEESLSRPSL